MFEFAAIVALAASDTSSARIQLQAEDHDTHHVPTAVLPNARAGLSAVGGDFGESAPCRCLRSAPTKVPPDLFATDIFDVIEFFAGHAAFSDAHRKRGRDVCEMDILHGRHGDLTSPAGFASGPCICLQASQTRVRHVS